MESLNALIRWHGADAPRRRPGGDAAGQPAAALAGDCEEVRAVTAAADWLRRPALNIPEAGLALTALESLLAHHDPAQLAVIAAKLHCAPDVHAIKAALALALPSVQGQMESLAVDMGYSAGCWPSSIRWRLARASRRWSSLWASER